MAQLIRHGPVWVILILVAAAATARTPDQPAVTSSFSTITASRPTLELTAAGVADGCPPNQADQLYSTGWASQVVTVEASGYNATYATLTAWQRRGSCWVSALGPWTARIGAHGFSNHKREGDDATPAGAFGVGTVMYGNATDPGVHYQYHRLVCGDWWDEDPSSPQYNTFQHLACGQGPRFGGDREALWEETRAYPSFAVIDYNTSPVVPGVGSAIFLHADIGGPTAGCVSLPLNELDRLLDWFQPTDHPAFVMGPATEIASL